MAIRRNKKNVVLLLLLLFIFFPLQIVFADVGLSVAPQKYELTVFPGENYKGQFKIHNPSAIALPVDLKIIPFGAEEETGKVVLDENISPENPASWLKPETRNLLLASKENRRINFEIDVPIDAPEGGYYMIAQFQLRIPDFQMERYGTRTVPTVGIPILIATTELALDKSPEKEDLMEVIGFTVASENRVGFLESIFGIGRQIASIGSVLAKGNENPKRTSFDFQITRGQPDKFSLLVKNNDIFHFRPQGTLTVYDSLNRKVATTKVAEQTILPGMSRRFDLQAVEKKEEESVFPFATIFTNIMVGRYMVELDIKGQSPIYEEIVPRGGIFSLSVLSVTPLLFWPITLLAITALFFGRKRIKMAWQFLRKPYKN